MAWHTDQPEKLEAVAYTRDYSAQSVSDELQETGGKDFSREPEFINYYSRSDWKVYKISISIEPVEG